MPRTGFNCRRCGHCCRSLVDAYRGCVSDADLERWRRQQRDDLLLRVQTLDLGPGNRLHLAWFDPASGEEVESCPWLLAAPDSAQVLCGINSVKPDHCRDFPQDRGHAAATGCPGYRPLLRKP